MDLEIRGLNEILKELDRLEGISDDIRDEALIAGGEVLKDEMKQQVYNHGLHRGSGEAQESIVRTDPKEGVLYVGTQGGAQVPGFYLYFHEFGYYNVRAQRMIPPKPFASIALEMSRAKILEVQLQVARRRLGM
jgi:hypothetical protein